MDVDFVSEIMVYGILIKGLKYSVVEISTYRSIIS